MLVLGRRVVVEDERSYLKLMTSNSIGSDDVNCELKCYNALSIHSVGAGQDRFALA